MGSQEKWTILRGTQKGEEGSGCERDKTAARLILTRYISTYRSTNGGRGPVLIMSCLNVGNTVFIDMSTSC